jgi:hypothetical protein
MRALSHTTILAIIATLAWAVLAGGVSAAERSKPRAAPP